MIYFCCDERRRAAVLAHPSLNGIDFLEVDDEPLDPDELRQRTLLVHFVKPLSPGVLTEHNVRIEGGERIRNVAVVRVTTLEVGSPPLSPPAGADARVLSVEVDTPGDFSTYTLRLVKDAGTGDPPDGFDQVLSSIAFSFKVNCPSDFDCKPQRVCPEEPPTPPEINYLAKDYASFHQLMLDRMAVLAPGWTERNAADLGVALVELLAYVGDYLSYQQDAVATESYLGTARRRVSVRRHARLVDYPMHDGRNARVWVQVRVSALGDGLTLARGVGRTTTKLLTQVDALRDSPIIPQASEAWERALATRPRVFELMDDITLFEAHNQIRLYTWGARECCLPRGALRATLDGAFPHLAPGHVLVLVERRGPQTGATEDADPTHRHAVRLTRVTVTRDELGGQFRTPPDAGPAPVTEIEWERADALPFPLCVSARVGTAFHDDVGIALGNIVLADHGMTVTDEAKNPTADPDTLPTSLAPAAVPAHDPALTRITPATADRFQEPTITNTPARYRPRVTQAPITQAAPYAGPSASARATRRLPLVDPARFPRPVITLLDPHRPGRWEPRRDLLDSTSADRHFVVEIESDQSAYLRFGDDRTGLRPAPGTRFLATYRVGNGAAGNVGADTIRHVVSSDPAFVSDLTTPTITGVSNPLAAAGGLDAETSEHVRQNAPSAFRRQERAVTPADYEDLVVREDVAERCDLDVQRAAATLRWTGSWHTMFVTVDRLGGREVSADFEDTLRRCLERFRMAGQDLEVDGPRYVSLELDLVVCVKRGYFFGDVEAALREVFSNRILPDGRRGVFHPDHLSFGQPVLLSPIVAAAQAVTGVDSVSVVKFQRQGTDSRAALDSGRLELGRLEIGRLDNDPNFPERGVLRVTRG
jgi:hypothetical protein